METRQVFVTGATGYLGRPLVAELLAHGHTVSYFRVNVTTATGTGTPLGAKCLVIARDVGFFGVLS